MEKRDDYKIINGFSQGEIAEIKEELNGNSVHFLVGKTNAGTDYRPWFVFDLAIRKDDFVKGLKILKELYNIREPSLFTGICPACQHKIKANYICPTCGLYIMDDSIVAEREHPFVQYLYKENLLSPLNRKIYEKTPVKEAPNGFFFDKLPVILAIAMVTIFIIFPLGLLLFILLSSLFGWNR